MASELSGHGRRYLVDARAGLVGAIAVGAATLGGRYVLDLPAWALGLLGLSGIGIAAALLQPQRRRQRRLAQILQDPSSSSSAFRLVDFIKTQLMAQRPPGKLRRDIETVVRLRHFPHRLLAEPFQRRLAAETVSTADRQQLVRWAEGIQRERGFVRERVVENIRTYLRETMGRDDFLVLYGYSSTVCEGIIRLASPDLVVFVVEDLQYGADSVREHETVQAVLTSAGIPCHAVPFAALDQLLRPTAISTTTLDGRRLSLPRRRRLVAMLGCDAIDQFGRALIPSVVAGIPSDSACLAEAFLEPGHQDRVDRRLLIVGESYKVAAADQLPRTRTSAPLRPSLALKVLHWAGLAVPFRAKQAYLYEVGAGSAAIITDAGVELPGPGGVTMSAVRQFWRSRLGDPTMFADDVQPAAPTRGPAGTRHTRIGAVVFDWNGVLALDEPLHFAAFAQLCLETAGAALSYPDYEAWCAGQTDHEGVLNLLVAGFASVAGGDAERLVVRKRALYAQAAAASGMIVAPGTAEFLRGLRRDGIRFCVVTASPLADVAAIRTAVGLDELLPDERIYADVASQDREQTVARAVAGLGVPPESVLLVDDTERNIVIGLRLGMMTVRIDSRPDSCRTEADLCVRSAVDLRAVLARAAARADTRSGNDGPASVGREV